MGNNQFSKLLEPGHLGKVKTKNRIVRSAASIIFLDEDFFVIKEQSIPLYEAFARGGAGLVIVGGGVVDHPRGTCHPHEIVFNDDKYMPGYRDIVDVIHKYGCPAFASIFHGGALRGFYNMMANESIQPVCSSDMSRKELQTLGFDFGIPARGLSVAEIKELINMFADAAVRCQKAGFDGVEVNTSIYHLGNSFLSRVWNKRDDEYGTASLETRARFMVEIIREIKRRLGKDFPVGILMNGAEFGNDKATTPEEGRGFAVIFEKAGVDYIQVRSAGYQDYNDLHLPETIFLPEPPKPLAKPLDGSHHGAGSVVPLAEGIKKVVSVPVITVGRLDAELGEKALEEGKADFIAMQRRLIADPELPNKVREGRLEDIAPCTACLGCFASVMRDEPIQCRINAALGGARNFIVDKAPKKKKVLVIGGGPAGMEAARVAALRGHEVVLYEKECKLGGLMRLAYMVKNPGIEDLQAINNYLSTQIAKLGVDIRLGKRFTLSLIDGLAPDAVIVATGGIPVIPKIPGVQGGNVMDIPKLHKMMKFFLKFLNPGTIKFLTKFWMPIGKRIVIIGGGLYGLELAEFLTKTGRKVTIVETAPTLADDRWFHVTNMQAINWLSEKGVVILTEVKYDAITDKGLTVTTKDGKKQTIEADTVIPVAPLSPNNELVESLKGKVAEVYSAGDCAQSGLIINAIAAGYNIARNL